MPDKLKRKFCPRCRTRLLAIIRETTYLRDQSVWRVIWEFYHDKRSDRVRRKRRCRAVRYAQDPNLPFERMTALPGHA